MCVIIIIFLLYTLTAGTCNWQNINPGRLFDLFAAGGIFLLYIYMYVIWYLFFCHARVCWLIVDRDPYIYMIGRRAGAVCSPENGNKLKKNIYNKKPRLRTTTTTISGGESSTTASAACTGHAFRFDNGTSDRFLFYFIF